MNNIINLIFFLNNFKRILERNQIWTEIYKVINLKNRDDLLKILIQSLDYNL